MCMLPSLRYPNLLDSSACLNHRSWSICQFKCRPRTDLRLCCVLPWWWFLLLWNEWTPRWGTTSSSASGHASRHVSSRTLCRDFSYPCFGWSSSHSSWRASVSLRGPPQSPGCCWSRWRRGVSLAWDVPPPHGGDAVTPSVTRNLFWWHGIFFFRAWNMLTDGCFSRWHSAFDRRNPGFHCGCCSPHRSLLTWSLR